VPIFSEGSLFASASRFWEVRRQLPTKSVEPHDTPEERPRSLQLLFSFTLNIRRGILHESGKLNRLHRAEHRGSILDALLNGFVPSLLIFTNGLGSPSLSDHTDCRRL